MNWPPKLYLAVAGLFFGLALLGLGMNEFNRFITKEYFEQGWEAYSGPDLDLPEYLFGAVMLLVALCSSVIGLWGRNSITLIELSGVKRLAVKRVLSASPRLTELRKSMKYLLVGSIAQLLLALVIIFMGGSFSFLETLVFWLPLSILNCNSAMRIARDLSAFQTGPEYTETLTALQQALPSSADPRSAARIQSRLQLQSFHQWYSKILGSWTASEVEPPSPIRIALHVMIVAQQVICCLVATCWAVVELSYPIRYILLMLLPSCVFIGFVCTQIVLPKCNVYAASCGLVVPLLALPMCFIADRAVPFFFTSLFLSQILGFSLLVSRATFKDAPMVGKSLFISVLACGAIVCLLAMVLTPEMIEIVFSDYSGLLVVLLISIFIGLAVLIQKTAGDAAPAIYSLLWVAVLLMAIHSVFADYDWQWPEFLVLCLSTFLSVATYPHITSKYSDFWFNNEAQLWGLTSRIRDVFSPNES